MENKISRREFAKRAGIVMPGLFFLGGPAEWQITRLNIKAIVFDGFPIFDPRPIFEHVNELFPEKGKQLIDIWKSNQFSYQWLRISAGKYKNFWELTLDALYLAASACGITLTNADKISILDKYRTINIWPDVIPALESFNNSNLSLAILSNMTPEMLAMGIANSNTAYFFDHILSTDKRKTFKPNPIAYQMAIDALQLKKEEILFVASAAWDMAGAKWFGYPTFWVNRLNAPIEKLDADPDGVGKDLNDLTEFVKTYNT